MSDEKLTLQISKLGSGNTSRQVPQGPRRGARVGSRGEMHGLRQALRIGRKRTGILGGTVSTVTSTTVDSSSI